MALPECPGPALRPARPWRLGHPGRALRHFWELLGFDPLRKEHLAAEWQDLIDPDDLQLALENFNRHCADPGHPYDQVVRYRHRDGSTVWVRCRGVAIRDETGRPVRMLGAHTDLTPQKKAEEALRRKGEELEQTNAQLQQALNEIKVLKGLLPICASCKKILDDEGYWTQIEAYIREHSEAEFTHGICPECARELYPEIDLGPAAEELGTEPREGAGGVAKT